MKNVIRRGGDKDHDKTFCIFAVRVNKDKSTGQRKLLAGTPYYLMQGFTIEDESIIVDKSIDTFLKDSIFNQGYQNQTTCAHLNFTAIVGMNGSGKSTLVEYMLRLINNISASVFGEYKQNDATDRLHYIDGVDGDLFYYSRGLPYRLSVKNDRVRLFHYKYKGNSDSGKHLLFEQNGTLYNNHRDGANEVCHYPFHGIGNDDIKYLFYTLVSNHSIYAYNSNDYINECCTDEIERSFEKVYNEKLKRENPKDIDTKAYNTEAKCWLHGLFHKNDGYQIPLVLNPFRKEGCIDINNENDLAKERLVSLIVNPRSEFRRINGHLEINNLTLTRSIKLYDRNHVNAKLEIEIESDEDYERIKEWVFVAWMNLLSRERNFGKEKRYYEDTRSYVCYKTLKIAKQYRQYQFFFDSFKKKEWKLDEYDIQQLVDKISLDSSHITGKLFQALDYLIYDIYTDEAIQSPIPVEVIRAIKKPVGTVSDLYPMNFLSASKVRRIPSPLFDVNINLVDTNNGVKVDFETLSSGEKQQTYAVSSLLYHLNNIDSVAEDNNGLRIVYRNVNIILEEVELYFHPELQKQLVKYIIDGIGQLNFISIRGINVVLVTHSPFVLSDIPASNILALKKDGTAIEGIRSFGSNIHDMLKDSFFLQSGWIGDFAKEHIRCIIKKLNREDREKFEKEERDKLHRSIMLIDEPIMRTMLLDKFREVYSESSIDQQIEELSKKIEDLKKAKGDVETQ